MAADEITFKTPPVTEVGFSISTALPEIVQPYDVKGAHDAFRAEFPEIERVAPTQGLGVAALMGAPPALLGTDLGASPRWWFKTSQGEQVLQAQERFWSFNWRRNPFLEEHSVYPGYAELRDRARRHAEALRQWHADNGMPSASPTASELLYVDTVCIERPKRLGDVFSFWNSDPSGAFSTAAFNLSWLEPVGEARGTMNVTLNHIMPADVDPHPDRAYFQVTFIAGALVSGWEDAFEFYDLAHSAITHRFLYMLTDEVKKEWIGE